MSSITIGPNSGLIAGRNTEVIDYSWNNPMAYTAFVPVVSLIMQKMQAQNILPIIATFPPSDALSRQFVHLCRWHLAGAFAQLFASAVAINVFALPIFVILVPISGYQVIDAALNCFQRVSIDESNGLISRNASVWGYLLDFTV